VAALRLAVLAGASLFATAAQADPVARWRPHSEEASRRFGVPLAWIERVLAAESGGRTRLHGRPITSSAGAMGLMQLMPGTWAELRKTLGLGPDPHDPRDNILAGTFYLRLMHQRFGYPGLFAAYNAGPARYSAWLQGRRALPAETRAYVASVAGTLDEASPAPAAPTPPPLPQPSLFAVRATADAASAPPVASSSSTLFVPLSRPQTP
jgi:soluble lytic murein transglycosylase-like protein